MELDISVALIGAGAMGEAIISGLLRQGVVRAERILAAEPRAERRDELSRRYGILMSNDNLDVARQGEVVIFAVKPQVLQTVLLSLHGMLRGDALCLSIMAGTAIRTFTTGLDRAAVVRAMPNTPAQIGEGMTVWTASPGVSEPQREWVRSILGALGQTLFVEDERYLDMATAINGSGPAYVFLILEAMIDAGVHLGFSRSDAETLVLQTVYGSVSYARQSGHHPAQLRNAVTSPGGTTAAGLSMLERGGLRTTLSDAIWAAYHRSSELGRKE
ncbi:MAG: pyrroline-5-carboxylate reductase [Chloroflexaceae bacterium]|nr:pyrroline-5-carboxylate reductase [Chloroflexaceae bacterium]